MGSGNLDGDPFGSISFTITAYGDTDNAIVDFFADFFIYHDAASITTDELGTYDFEVPTQTYVGESSPSQSQVGFGWYDTIPPYKVGENLFTGPTDSGFVGWEMQTSIGPLTGSGALYQWSFRDVVTSGGILYFDTNYDTTVTFSARVVPIPLNHAQAT